LPDASGNPAPAYTSVNFIQNTVYLGWLIRGVHFWGANLLIIMVILHMARVYWTGSYRAPRELNWMVGVLMLLIVLVFSLTGYLLPWDTKAYFATEVTIKIAGSAPPPQLGALIKDILQGGTVVGPPTLLPPELGRLGQSLQLDAAGKAPSAVIRVRARVAGPDVASNRREPEK